MTNEENLVNSEIEEVNSEENNSEKTPVAETEDNGNFS